VPGARRAVGGKRGLSQRGSFQGIGRNLMGGEGAYVGKEESLCPKTDGGGREDCVFFKGGQAVRAYGKGELGEEGKG